MATPIPAKKRNKISQIVRLKQVMQRWRRRCITNDAFTSDSDSDSDSDHDSSANHQRMPSAGNLAVYVGSERRRFIIPTRFLNLPVFVSLLNKAAEEFGFQTTGGLIIPCEVRFFKKLVKVLDQNENGFSTLDLDDFSAMFSDLSMDANSHCKDVNNSNCYTFTPLLQKARV
ncbi:protein SMALL AUXIN UP-REGULATED RNA 12-like [Rutidosis leptorrhynchoides]|uniref:protein SMALL AUXIN UP-REGULATED RNA 12-like n=1 Tax=Rutidosis leptorrhynchoides TaxID=125765 RepID=UPI003A996311